MCGINALPLFLQRLAKFLVYMKLEHQL